MHRISAGALLVVASVVVTQVGCVFAPTPMPTVEPTPSPEERLADLKTEVDVLEGELASAQAELDQSMETARAAEESAAAAQAETARAQDAAEAAARKAQAETERAQAAARAAQAETERAQAAASAAQAETSEARAAADAAETALAKAIRTLTQPNYSVVVQDRQGRRVELFRGLDLRMLNLDAALLSIAGPDSIYLKGILLGSEEFSARLRYPDLGMISDLDLTTPALDVVARDALVVSNVGIGGAAYAITLRFGADGTVSVTREAQGHKVRTAAELLRDRLVSAAQGNRIVRGFGGGQALPGEGTWSRTAPGTVSQTDAGASHAKFAIGPWERPTVPTLYGVTANADGSVKAGFGLHVLASAAPYSGNTWNFGRSYLLWATQEPAFFGTDDTQIQLYESLYESQDDNRLVWRKSRSIARPLSSGVTLEALYDPDDCMAMMGDAPCHGSLTVLADGVEQFTVAVSAEVGRGAADMIALRALGGPVEFTEVYVISR